jgi:heat shock protein HslJ
MVGVDMKLFGSRADLYRACCAGLVLTAVVSAWFDRPAVAQDVFPFNEELLLDTRPMPGSKRIPMLDIRADGAVLIDLWCNSVQGQLVVAENTITVLIGPKTNRTCTPERERGDQEMLSALEQVTTWRRDGSDVILAGGPKSLRFHRATN